MSSRRFSPLRFLHHSIGSGYVSIPDTFWKYLISVDLPAPIFPSIETLNGRSVGVFTLVNSLNGDMPTKLVFLLGDGPVAQGAGRLKALVVVITPSIFAKYVRNRYLKPSSSSDVLEDITYTVLDCLFKFDYLQKVTKMWWSSNKLKHLPLSAGRFVPGCMDVMLDYSKDGLFMRLFYPTNVRKCDKENSKRWISWLPDDSYLIGISKVLTLPVYITRLVFWWTDIFYVPALYGERPRTEDKLKCIVMSHGMGGSRFLYSKVCCDLASNGFLVVALEHRDLSACSTYYYNTQEDAKKDQRTMLAFKHIPFGDKQYELRNAQIKIKSNECSKVVDFLKKLNAGHVLANIMDEVPSKKKVICNLSDFVGHLDLESMSIMGHSFGGATALYAMSKQEDFKQCILLDPWMFPIKNENLDEKIDRPILFINTQTFHIESNVKAMSKFLTDDTRKMFTILRTTHENQSDSVLIVGYWLNWFMRKLDPTVALNINNALILTFLHEHIEFPTDVKEFESYLEMQTGNFETGLTKPWT